MKVKALRGFSAFVDGSMVCASEGQVLELPKGADWLRAGLVVPAEEGAEAEDAATEPPAVAEVMPETASTGPAETATPAKPRRRVMSTRDLKGE